MKINQDFVHWLKDKEDLISQLIESGSMIFNRLEPVYNTLSHFKDKELSDIERDIFDVGFSYFSTQIMAIENHIKLLGSLSELEEHSVLFNYLLDVNDFLEDHDLKNDNKEFVSLISDVEDLLQNKQQLDNSIFERIEALREKHNNSQSTIKIFEEISDGLGI